MLKAIPVAVDSLAIRKAPQSTGMLQPSTSLDACDGESDAKNRFGRLRPLKIL
jgi:hypothetical protein